MKKKKLNFATNYAWNLSISFRILFERRYVGGEFGVFDWFFVFSIHTSDLSSFSSVCGVTWFCGLFVVVDLAGWTVIHFEVSIHLTSNHFEEFVDHFLSFIGVHVKTMSCCDHQAFGDDCSTTNVRAILVDDDVPRNFDNVDLFSFSLKEC